MSHGSLHSVSMVSYNLDTRKRKADEISQCSRRPNDPIIWDKDRKGNRFIFNAHVVFREADKSQSVTLCIMADTGATCSVFDAVFVERNSIPCRR